MRNMPAKNIAALDPNLLVAFDALMVERNVTRATSRIGLSQPAMSKALARLRDMFDDPLFERRDSVMEPTAQALGLGIPIRRALDEIQTALSPGEFDPGSAHACITIGSLDFYDLALLPQLMIHLRRTAPGISIAVRRTDRLRVQHQLAAGEIDFAIVPVTESTTDLHADPLFTETAVTLMSRRNPLTKKLSLASFAAAGHVTVAVEGQGLSWIDSQLAIRGMRRSIVLTVPTFLTVPFVVGSSDLISTLPRRLATKLAPATHIVAVPPPLQAPEITIHLASHARSTASPLHRWIRETIKAVASRI